MKIKKIDIMICYNDLLILLVHYFCDCKFEHYHFVSFN